MIFWGFNHTPIPQPIFWTAPDTVYDVYGSSYSVISSTFYHAWYWGLFHMGRRRRGFTKRPSSVLGRATSKKPRRGRRDAVSEVVVAPKITKKWAKMSILILNPPYCIWLVVWNIFYIFPYIGNKVNNWLIFFQRGWNHQSGIVYWVYCDAF